MGNCAPRHPLSCQGSFTSLLAIPELFARFGETDRTNTPMPAVQGEQALRTSLGGREGGLIAFDRQDGLGLLRMDDAYEVGLRVQGIGSTDSMLDRQGGQHGLRHRDLVGFFVHAHLEDTFPGCDGSRRPADGERSARQIGLPARSCHPVRAARRPGLPWWLVPSFPTRAQGRRHRVAATASDIASRLPVRKSRGQNTRRSTGR